MKRCLCGTSVNLFSLYPVCGTCLQAYLGELPHRPGFSIDDFRQERLEARQGTAEEASGAWSSRRVRLLDIFIDPVTVAEASVTIKQYVEAGVPHQLVTVNVDFVRIAQENEQFRRIVNTADLSVADGKPLLWAARWTGQEIPARVTGMDLLLGSAELATRRNESIFLLGAAEGVGAQAAAKLQAMFPGLQVHVYAPPMGPFSVEENEHMVGLIRASGAKYLFVAFGAPKQDVWINEHLDALDVPVCVGIGGVLNFLAGTVKRAPGWVQGMGMEWLYRVMQEPTRLWRRYFVEDMPVFIRMLLEPAVEDRRAMRQPMQHAFRSSLPIPLRESLPPTANATEMVSGANG